MRGQMEYYFQIGISIDEYVQTVGIQNLMREQLLDLAIDVFVLDKKEKSIVRKKYREQSVLLKPIELKKLLPFS